MNSTRNRRQERFLTSGNVMPSKRAANPDKSMKVAAPKKTVAKKVVEKVAKKKTSKKKASSNG